MIKKTIFILLRISLIPFLFREIIQRKKVTIILYHEISLERAEQHFNLLKKVYNIISLKKYITEIKKNGSIEKLPNKSLILTFDDGVKNNYDLLNLFRQYKITPTIFICSSIVGTTRHFWWKRINDNNQPQYLKRVDNKKRLELMEKYGFKETSEYNSRQALSFDEINKMKEVVDFQSHTRFHPILTKCSDRRAYKEIALSKQELEKQYGLEIYSLAYPNGDYSKREIMFLKKAGYQCGLSLKDGYNDSGSDLYELKRICIPDDAKTFELLVRASGLWDILKNIFKVN